METVTINKKARLSQHFTLGELCKTSARTADGNIPSHVHIENLKRLCGWLEELRRRWNNLNNEDYDELLIEQKGHTYWIHFAVKPSGNRRRTNFKR